MATDVEKIEYIHCHKILPLVYDESLSYYETICKFQQKLNEAIDDLDGLKLDVLTEAEAYTDEAIKNRQASINEIVAELKAYVKQTKIEFASQINDLQTQYSKFVANVNAILTIYNNKLDELEAMIKADIIGVNARTDLAIKQNNEYIFDTIQNKLPTELKVTNMFTGEKISIQDMFNYLGKLHVADGITFTTLASRNKTYNKYRDLHISYTDIVLHGNSLVV